MADGADALYRQFDPFHPLDTHETRLYVDWQRQVGIILPVLPLRDRHRQPEPEAVAALRSIYESG